MTSPIDVATDADFVATILQSRRMFLSVFNRMVADELLPCAYPISAPLGTWLINNPNPVPNKSLRLASFNCRTLLPVGYAEILCDDLVSMNIDCCVVTETRWAGSGEKVVYSSGAAPEKFVVFWSGEVNQGHGGVAIFIKANLRSSITGWSAVSERIIKVNIGANVAGILPVTIVGVYAPHESLEVAEREQFWAVLRECSNSSQHNHRRIVAGDFNAMIAIPRRSTPSLGSFGLQQQQNSNGDFFLGLLTSAKLSAVTTRFKLRYQKNHATHRRPGGTLAQLDYILCDQRFSGSALRFRNVWNTRIRSDHSMLIVDFKMSLSRRCKRQPVITPTRKDIAAQLDSHPEVQIRFNANIGDLFQTNDLSNADMPLIASKVVESAKAAIQTQSQYKSWISDETRIMVESARHLASAADRQSAQRSVKRALRSDFQSYLMEVAAAAEYASTIGDMKGLFSAVKDLISHNRQQHSEIKGADGSIIGDFAAQRSRWAAFCENNFRNDDAIEFEPVPVPDDKLLAPQKALDALGRLKKGKAGGPSGMLVEHLQALNEENKTKAAEIVCCWWNNCFLPLDVLNGTIVPVFKRGDKKECGAYRLLTMLEIWLKWFESCAMEELKPYLEQAVPVTQAGFCAGKSCQDQVATVTWLLQQREEFQRESAVLLVDFATAFDSVSRDGVKQCLLNKGVPLWLVQRLMMTLVPSPTQVQWQRGRSDFFKIKAGIRQGSLSGPPLFLFVVASITEELKEKLPNVGVYFGNADGLLISLEFADDIIIICDPKDLQIVATTLADIALRYGLLINTSKTQTIGAPPGGISLHGNPVNDVSSAKYLGVQITNDGSSGDAASNRIKAAASRFECLYPKLFRRTDVSDRLKGKLFSILIRPILLYCTPIMALRAEDCQRLDVCERSLLRRAIKGWRLRPSNNGSQFHAPISNAELYSRTGLNVLSSEIEKRRITYIGHLFRRDPQQCLPLQALLTEPPRQWRRRPGRPKKTFRHVLCDTISRRRGVEAGWHSTVAWINRHAGDRSKWREFAAGAMTVNE
jgi:exonuclease III